jgi:hypothetical protein
MPIVKISDITIFGDRLARSIRSRYVWSKQLRNAVKLHPGQDRGGKVSISITIGEGKLDKSGMPLVGMAKAYESGSQAGTYLLRARLRPKLVFRMKDGRMFKGKQVMHPRMEKRGDIQAAIDATLAKSTDELKLRIRQNVIDMINIAIKDVSKK